MQSWGAVTPFFNHLLVSLYRNAETLGKPHDTA
jgi:hypothetical protein